MPGKGDGARRARRTPAFRRPEAERVVELSLQLLRRRRGRPPSQAELLRAVGPRLQEELPRAALGGRRLRRLLLATPGVRVEVTYAERRRGPPPTRCPVCGTDLQPVRNRTLDGTSIAIGARCTTCGYWTHRRPRLPIRYGFRAVAGGRAKLVARAPAASA